jgi:PAS domain S-box-containing protein
MSEKPKNSENLTNELAASEAIFRLLVESVKDYAIYVINPDGIVTTWNLGAERITGHSASEIIGHHFSCFYPEETRDKEPTIHLAKANELGSYEEEGWRIRKDGSRFWAGITLTPLFEQGKLVGYAKITRDLSERNLASQSEQVFKLLVNSVADYAIFMLDPSGLVATWNEGAERIKGYKASEIIGKHFSVFYPKEVVESKHPQHELEIARKEGRYEEQGWRLRKDGSLFWANVTITAVYDNEQLIGFAKVTRDLSEQRLAEQKEEIFRLLVSGVSDYAIFMRNPEGYILTWNDGAQRIKGYQADEIIGKHFSIFYTQEAQKRRHPDRELDIARSVGRYEEEGWRLRKDGSLLWANVVITAIYDNKKLIGFAKVTRDLTQRLLADQERQMSAKILDDTNKDLQQALEVKSRFLATVSHEVRTPMSAIIGMTEVLTTEDLGEDNNSVVQTIFDSSRRLLQLLNNLLQSARMEDGNLTLENRNFPIRAVLGDIRQLINRDAKAKALRITGTCDSQIPEVVWGDELKVRQILLNLAHNAVKFTESGEVNISAEVKKQDSENITIRLSVKDTGIGIKPGDRDKLFQPFSQAHDPTKNVYGGTGLGLSISKQLAELMGGNLSYESEHGVGSTFWVEIPFSLENGR